MSYPVYLDTLRSGKLEEKVRSAVEALRSCGCCARDCGADRIEGADGVCRTGRKALVSSAFPHLGEEDILRGWAGSGTIFFSGCNLLCRFCQNWDISHDLEGREVEAREIADMALGLQEQGCHNINFVTPSHAVPQMLEAILDAARRGLKLPIVYNTGSYDSVETMRLLDGVIDIYMPDFKLWDPALAKAYLDAEDYPERARQAILEMRRQVGDMELDPKTGLARRGILLRHLVMPGCVEDSGRIFKWLAEELSPDTCVNVMAQYHAEGEVLRGGLHPEIARSLRRDEHFEAVELARGAGLHRFA